MLHNTRFPSDVLCVHNSVKRWLWLASVVGMALPGCRYYGDVRYRRVGIDLATRELRFAERLWTAPRRGEMYYAENLDFSDRTSARLIRDDQWYDLLYCDTARRLAYREKYQSLSGDVMAKTTYPYAPQYGSTIDVVTIQTGLILYPERPAVSMTAPASLGGLTLDDISVVRMFRTATVSANYAPTGALQAISVGGVGTSYIDRPAARDTFGLPETFPIGQYLSGTAPPWSASRDSAVVEFVYLHYARGSVVRQDRVDSSGRRVTRWLTFLTTPVDSALAPIDTTRQYGRALVASR